MKNITITIPTYWSWGAGEIGHPEDSIFDHPTPIDKKGTLSRCLESLKKIPYPSFRVLIITAPVNPRLSGTVEDKVERIISPFKKSYPIHQFGPSDLAPVKKLLEENEINPSIVGLDAYAQIRNCQILGSVLLKTDLIAAVDDDEVVPEDYLSKATEYAGKTVNNKRIDGIAGIYLNSAGDYRIKESRDARASSNLFKKKAALMNDQFSSYMAQPERIVETAVALGGNMVFTEDLFMNVPFDPGITRGEDIDYLLNSRILGFHWFLDKELYITHLPPPPSEKDPIYSSSYAKLQQDIIRFIYQREKIKLSHKMPGAHPLKPEDFGFYPGAFFNEDLEEHALAALKSLRPKNADEQFFPKPEDLIQTAKLRANNAERFLEFTEKWKQAIKVIEKDESLKERMRKKEFTFCNPQSSGRKTDH